MSIKRRLGGQFRRRLYGDILQTMTLRKRGDGQLQGQVDDYTLFRVRQGAITKTGNPIHADMTTNHTCTIHIPRGELDRVGVNYLNALDQLIDEKGRYWQPEADTNIDVRLFEDEICVSCERIDSDRS